ncbi:hypothetical protein PR202_ga11289 [Eleusine coracana subsp. coracana]|uniref:Secreted protein n=1 Tax=Eleusine coracana subsp. coracana TaxID=191504 RepID=A0AAV5C8L9_ELECO|nr:hypothetical protein PR202_ga11289 [Eleusine coracana subsp. coracana]
MRSSCLYLSRWLLRRFHDNSPALLHLALCCPVTRLLRPGELNLGEATRPTTLFSCPVERNPAAPSSSNAASPSRLDPSTHRARQVAPTHAREVQQHLGISRPRS